NDVVKARGDNDVSVADLLHYIVQGADWLRDKLLGLWRGQDAVNQLISARFGNTTDIPHCPRIHGFAGQKAYSVAAVKQRVDETSDPLNVGSIDLRVRPRVVACAPAIIIHKADANRYQLFLRPVPLWHRCWSFEYDI